MFSYDAMDGRDGAVSSREIELACENLVTTYFSIAQAAKDAFLVEDEGITSSIAPMAHPGCQIGIAGRPNPNSVARTVELARGHSSFTLYLLPSNEAYAVAEMLQRAGFTGFNQLQVMVRRPATELPWPDDAMPHVRIEPASGFVDRYECMIELMKHFFHSAEAEFAKGIAMLTAGSNGPELWRLIQLMQSENLVQETQVIVGGGMSVTSPQMVGLYNLAVYGGFRGRGLGSAMVQSVSLASPNQYLTLQCTPNLIDWYQRLGFRRAGLISVFRYI